MLPLLILGGGWGEVVLAALLSLFLLTASVRPARCASTDIVPRASVLIDDFSYLAKVGLLTSAHGSGELSPADFQGEIPWTRGQLAQLLAGLRDNSKLFARAGQNSRTVFALRDAAMQLSPELGAAGHASTAIPATHGPVLIDGTLGGILRMDDPADIPRRTRGHSVLYRVAGGMDLSQNARILVSASDWFLESRRVFDNDVKPHGFSGVNEAYLDLTGRRGLSVQIGRLENNWGAGAHGSVLLSDNAPPMDQVRVSFPFSLGRHFGREYRFSQMAAGFEENGKTKYFEARRIEYTFNRQWSAEFAEAFKSSRAGSLFATPFPLNMQTVEWEKVLPGTHFQNLDSHFNYVVNLGSAYSWGTDSRVYGQFFIDDLRNPFGDAKKQVVRKIAYLAGYATGSPDATNFAVEYSQADPTTYTFQNNEATWQHGQFNQIGLPEGPNNRTVYARLGTRVARNLTVSVDGRDRRRINNTYPAPTSRSFGLNFGYRLPSDQLIDLAFHDYRQDPFVVPGLPPHAGAPVISTPNPGRKARIREIDVSFRRFF